LCCILATPLTSPGDLSTGYPQLNAINYINGQWSMIPNR
jgi:hypothetical protein